MTEDPALIPAALHGLRAWAVVGPAGDERLAGPQHRTPWPTQGAWLEATCEHERHPAPAAACNCGVHAWHPRPRWARRVLESRRAIPGVVELRGAVEVHLDGLRAERARPYALVQGRRNPALVRRLAEAYGVPVIASDDPGALLDWCRERGLGLDEEIVGTLLGADEVERVRRTRRRRLRAGIVRSAAALAAVGALLALASALMPEPKGDRVLFGRTGPVHVHH